MLTGKRFRLKETTLSIEAEKSGYRQAVPIPAGEIIQVSRPRLDDTRMIDVLWNDRPLAMFAEDIEGKATEI